MRKLEIIFLFSLLLYSCNNREINPKESNTKFADTIKYDIETITYWGTGNKRETPFIVVKVDTVNHIGSSVRYTEDGKVFERIVILDAKNAIKLDYNNDTISSKTICHYKVRRDHPTKLFYSIVAWK